LRHRVRPEQALEVGREECVIVRPLAPDAPERQAVLGEGDVAHLPGDVADAAGRLSEPLVGGRLVEQADGVVAGEDDLFDGELQPGHDYFSFAGSAPTNFTARPIQPANWSSPSTPPGSTSTQPFIGLPVMSNPLTCGSFSASLASSGPSRPMRESFQTPTSRLPFSRKPTPPNIFFSSTPLLRARAWRIRSASAALKAIGHSSHRGSPTFRQRVFYHG